MTIYPLAQNIMEVERLLRAILTTVAVQETNSVWTVLVIRAEG